MGKTEELEIEVDGKRYPAEITRIKSGYILTFPKSVTNLRSNFKTTFESPSKEDCKWHAEAYLKSVLKSLNST